jgi:hypothetical protein
MLNKIILNLQKSFDQLNNNLQKNDKINIYNISVILLFVSIIYKYLFNINLYGYIVYIVTYVTFLILTLSILNKFKISKNKIIKILIIYLILNILMVIGVYICDYFGINLIPSVSCDGDDNGIIATLKELYEEWNLMLNTLTLEQLGALAHLICSVTMLLCLISILVIVYSDFFLVYLKIEEKFPRIGKIIKLRRKFQQFYLFINFTIIFLFLIAIIFVNYTVLLKTL